MKPATRPTPEGMERALLISLVCLLVPVAITGFAPELLSEDQGALIWLLALIPAFLLSHLRGWRGASVALAGGMAAVALSHGVLLARGAEPSPVAMLFTVGAILVVGLGAGASSTLLLHSRMEAQEQALRDPGTGLPNRRHALLHLERAFAAARRGTDVAAVMFDLDRFKQINDRYGHAVGDEVLRSFGDLLRDRTREMNLTARVGGEEFLTILEGCVVDGAVRFAENVRWGLQDMDFPFGKVTVSAGVAVFEPGMASPDVLLAAADQALYLAKEQGRDRVAVAGPAGSSLVRNLSKAAKAQSQPVQGKGELLLVVDDDAAARRSITKALRRLGFEVIEAGGPEQALQISKGLDAAPDLLITDVIMPSMSGFQLGARLMEHTRDLRALYMSGYIAEDEGWKGAPGAVTGFLKKPASLEELGGAVRRLLDHPLPEPDAPEESRGEPGEAPAGLPAPSPPSGGGAPPDVPELRHPSPAPILLQDRDGDGRAHPILMVGAREEDIPRLDVRLRHLGYAHTARATFRSFPRGVEPELVVAWVSEPLDRAVDILDAYLQRWEPRERPPLLILAPRLPAELSGRWPTLFPSLFLTQDVGLGELDLHIQHLRRLHAWRSRDFADRASMEAQVEARNAELESTQGDLLLRLARAAELRDDLTGHHAERVGTFSGLLARELGLSAEEVRIIEGAAPLHDLGKIAIPDAILNKPAALTPTEQEIMRRHTVIGARLLSGSRNPLLQEAQRIARSHHERWDGTGYPDGLSGEAIPPLARIVAVADVLDCITHARPYRKANTRERALAAIQESGGEHFDPQVVRAINALERRGELEIDPDRAPVAPKDSRPLTAVEVRRILEGHELER